MDTRSPFCGSSLSNIVSYCKYQSQIKALDQKGTKRFNTAGNQTQISRSMRYSQIIKSYAGGNGGGSSYYVPGNQGNPFCTAGGVDK
jgi:hypothetical protein